MMAYAVEVMVIDRKTRKGLPGHRVKCYGGTEVKTDASGRAVVISNSSNIEVYVDGMKVYSGSVSNAPRPILYERS